MDTLRGSFGALDDAGEYDADIEDDMPEAPPAAIGQDERRMQVRAYNHWASLLGSRNFPAIEDLEPALLPDFGPCSVLLDFTAGIENPGIAYLGERLAEECAVDTPPQKLGDVPSRSLLSRITDHYMQILANQAPIGFEAEFVNQHGMTILYRGVLLPFSSDDETIDFIFGVINWREMADLRATDELLLEIDQALDARPRHAAGDNGLTDWADGPGAIPAMEDAAEFEPDSLPRPSFAFAGPAEVAPAGAWVAEEPAFQPDAMDLADWLAAARETAATARASEDRSRSALYDAIGRAHDFALAAADAPGEFAALLSEAGLTMQERAPMTPVVKLVFGTDYDKTRLTEYAAALDHARRLGLPHGALAQVLRHTEGGLKAVVQAERQFRREQNGKPARPAAGPRPALARKLRALPPTGLEALAAHGSEFALVMIRRTEAGEVTVLGEVPEDAALVDRAARRLTA